MNNTSPTAERFRRKYMVNKETGCWDWIAGLRTGRYGVISEQKTRKKLSAHRYSYELHVGKIKPGNVICHSCDNTKCVNPSHLFQGSPRDNIMDCIKKGRAVYRPRFGSSHPRSKLTSKNVLFIRNAYASKTLSAPRLAAKYKVKHQSICDVIHRRTWKHVK